MKSGCTNHMTNDKELFKNLYETNITKVRIGNGNLINVKGKNSISLESCQGTKVIHDILYVPQINQNLHNVGQLLEKDYKVIFENNFCIIKDKSEVDLFKIKMKGKNFSFNPLKEEQSSRMTTNLDIEVWHKRMGHFNVQGTKQTSQLCLDVPNFNDELPSCVACQHGKDIRKYFSKIAWRATKKLELVHSDLCGPQRTLSLGGCLYYVIFINDYTRMCWIFFMKNKSEVSGVFKKFKSKVENQSECRINTVRADNEREYVCHNFDSFFDDEGIEHQLTTPYTPQ